MWHQIALEGKVTRRLEPKVLKLKNITAMVVTGKEDTKGKDPKDPTTGSSTKILMMKTRRKPLRLKLEDKVLRS